MLTNRILPRLVLSAVLLAAGATLPAVAHAHDGRGDREWRRDYDNNDRWERHRYWEHRRSEQRHWDTRYQPRVYERSYVEPRAYYAPAPVILPPPPGVTFIFRDRW